MNIINATPHAINIMGDEDHSFRCIAIADTHFLSKFSNQNSLDQVYKYASYKNIPYIMKKSTGICPCFFDVCKTIAFYLYQYIAT